MQPSFEYKVTSLDSYLLEEQLNKLGSEGWELIHIQVSSSLFSNFVFKRKTPFTIPSYTGDKESQPEIN